MTKKTERQIINEILRKYATRPDVRLWRQNTGSANFGGQVVRFGLPGQADITGIYKDGRRIEIEVKTPTVRQSRQQKAFERTMVKFNCIFILARSVEDVDEVFKGL